MNITDLATLPTDSLYKFMSLSGFVITFVFVVLPEIVKKNIKFQLFDIEKARKKQKYEHEIMEEFNNKLKIKAQRMMDRILEKPLPDCADIPKVQEELSECEKGNEKVEEYLISFNNYCCETECELEKIKYLSSIYGKTKNYQITGLFLGLSLSVVGLYCWYTKLQIYIDSAMKLSGTKP